MRRGMGRIGTDKCAPATFSGAHRAALFLDGRWRCRCGWDSERGLSPAEAEEAAAEHVDLVIWVTPDA